MRNKPTTDNIIRIGELYKRHTREGLYPEAVDSIIQNSCQNLTFGAIDLAYKALKIFDYSDTDYFRCDTHKRAEKYRKAKAKLDYNPSRWIRKIDKLIKG